jgi:hypothetical protein
MEKEVVEACYLDVDFFDRTTFKHITDYGYSDLMSDPKVTQLLQRMWAGESQKCNGSPADFSMMAYLATAPVRRLPN